MVWTKSERKTKPSTRGDSQQVPLCVEPVTEGCAGPTVQGDAGHVDEVEEVKGHQANSSEDAHGREGRPPIPAERALLLRSHTDTHRMKYGRGKKLNVGLISIVTLPIKNQITNLKKVAFFNKARVHV